ncbi:TPA: hypothetical protein ACGVDH_002198, partial [Enterococcus faecium]
VKDNRNSIRKEVLHLIKFVKKTVAIPSRSKLILNKHKINTDKVIFPFSDKVKQGNITFCFGHL